MLMNTFQLNVNIKTVLYLRIVRHARYKIKISDVNPWPGKQASAARYRAAAHSLSSTGRKELVPKQRAKDCKSLCLNHTSPRWRDKERKKERSLRLLQTVPNLLCGNH